MVQKAPSGPPLTFAVDTQMVSKMLATDPFMSCPEEDTTLPAWEKFACCIKTNMQSYDLLAILPDGRPFLVDFQGQARSMSWLESLMRARFPSQFSSEKLTVYGPCRCGQHWRPVPYGVAMPAGKNDLCVLILGTPG